VISCAAKSGNVAIAEQLGSCLVGAESQPIKDQQSKQSRFEQQIKSRQKKLWWLMLEVPSSEPATCVRLLFRPSS